MSFPVAAHEDGIIDDEKFVLLSEQNTSKNPHFPYEEYSDLLLEDIDQAGGYRGNTQGNTGGILRGEYRGNTGRIRGEYGGNTGM